MKTKTLNIITIIAFVFTITFANVYSAETSSALNLKLISQSPDPVKAGDDVTIRLGVENLGQKEFPNLKIKFVDSYPFTLFQDENREEFLGTLFARSTGNDAQIVKFKLQVADDVKDGTYPIKIIATSGVATFEEEFLVEVKSNSNAEISKISVDSLIPGEKTKISFTIKNVGKSDLENVKFSWESQDDIILPVSSGNFKYIDRIEKEQEEVVDFYVVSDLNTQPKLYKLDLKLEYDDVESLQKITDAGTIETQSRREVIAKAGIYVGGGTDFEISQKSSTSNSVTLSIANIGSNLASSVVIKIPNQEHFETTGSNSKVIGNIKKGAFSRAEFDINQLTDSNTLDIIVEYTDTTGKRQAVNITSDVSLSSEIQELDFNKSNSNSSNTSTFIIIILILIIVGGFMYNKKKSKQN